MAKQKTKKTAAKKRKPPPPSRRTPARPRKKPTAPELPPVTFTPGLHQSALNFLATQKLADIVGLWEALRQCRVNGDEVTVPGIVAAELVRYIERTQPLVQLYLRLPKPVPDSLAPKPTTPPDKEP